MNWEALSAKRIEIFALHEKTEHDVSSDINILREWMKKEPHLPSDLLQDQFLEIYLLKNKFSVEKTKTKLENYCTLKAMERYSYLFEHLNDYVPSKEPMCYITIPTLTKKYQRVTVGKIFDQDQWDFQRDLMSGVVLRELASRYDYNNGEIWVVDYTECSSMPITKLRPNVLADAVTIALKAHSARIDEIHIVGKIVFNLVGLVKSILPSKIGSRIHVHETVDTLKNTLPEECLPKDFGGNLKTIEEWRAELDVLYENSQEEIAKYLATKSREELRQGEYLFDDMKGTFKKLNID